MDKQKVEAPAAKTKEAAVSNYKYKLVRKSDNLTKEGNEITFVAWKSNGTFQSLVGSPMVGTSMALDLELGVRSTHITDQITKIVEVSEGSIKFETKDGLYECTTNKGVPSSSEPSNKK